VLAPIVPHVLAPHDLSQYARVKQQGKYNAWAAKSIMLHDHEQLSRLNPHEPFTKFPLALFAF
jgi:hypothetical protein